MSKGCFLVRHAPLPQPAMTNFLDAAPRSVSNGAVKTWSYQKKQETEVPTVTVVPAPNNWSLLLQPESDLAPQQRNNNNHLHVLTDATSFDCRTIPHWKNANSWLLFFSVGICPQRHSKGLCRVAEEYFYVHYNPGSIHGNKAKPISCQCLMVRLCNSLLVASNDILRGRVAAFQTALLYPS